MAETTFFIKFRAQIREARKGFKEVSRQQKTLDRQRKKQLRFEQRAARQQATSIRKVSREKERASRREMLAERGRIRMQESERRRVVKHQQQESRTAQSTVARDRNRIRSADKEIRRSFFGRFGRTAMKGAAFAGAGLVGMLIGGALGGYQKFQGAVGAQRGTVGLGIGFTGPRQAAGYGGLGSAGRGTRGLAAGYNAAETQALMAAASRATGSNSVRTLMRTEAYGLPTAQGASFMGSLRQGGTTFGGEYTGLGQGAGGEFELQGRKRPSTQGRSELVKTLAKGLFTGLEMARMPEFFSAVTTLMEQQQQMTGGRVTTAAAANVLAILGSTGAPGLQGTRGGRVAQKLQQGIQQPGGGGAGQALVQQAFGFGKPGGTASYYGARKFMQQGFGEGGEGLEKVMREIIRQGSNMEERSLMMEAVFGTNLDTNERILKVFTDDSVTLQDRMTALAQLQEQGKNLEQQAVDAMSANTAELRRNASLFNQSLRDGATAAKGIQNLEEMQRDFFNMMVKNIPKIRSGIQAMVRGIDNLAQATVGVLDSPEAGRRHTKAKELQQQAEEAFAAGDTAGGMRLLDLSKTTAQSAADYAWEKSKNTGVRNREEKRRAREAQHGRSGHTAEYNEFYGQILNDVRSRVGDKTFNRLIKQPSFRERVKKMAMSIHGKQPKRVGQRGIRAAETFFYEWVNANEQEYNRMLQEAAPEKMGTRAPPSTTGHPTGGSVAPVVGPPGPQMSAVGMSGQPFQTRIIVLGEPGRAWHEDATTSVARARADGSGNVG